MVRRMEFHLVEMLMRMGQQLVHELDQQLNHYCAILLVCMLDLLWFLMVIYLELMMEMTMDIDLEYLMVEELELM